MDLESKKEKGKTILWKHLKDSEVWFHSQLARGMWIWFLIEAEHPDRHEYDRKYFIKRGQILKSYRQIAEGLKVKKGLGFVLPKKEAIDRTLRWMKEQSMVETKPTTHGTIITLINFDAWDNGGIDSDDDTDDEWEYVEADELSDDTREHSLSNSLSNSKNPLTPTSVVPPNGETETDLRQEEKNVSPKEQNQPKEPPPQNAHPFSHADDQPDESEYAQIGLEATAHLNNLIGRTGIPAMKIRKNMGRLIGQVGWERFKEIVAENQKRLQSAQVPGAMLCAMIEQNPEKPPTPFHCPECNAPEFNKSKRNHGASSPGVPEKWKYKPIYECQKCKHRIEIPVDELPEKTKQRERKRNWRIPPQSNSTPRPFETIGDVIPSVMAGGGA